MGFEIQNDFEFYCFLKANLPNEYKIIAEPSTSYYSEWMYDYRIYHNDELVETVSGNFKDVNKGELVLKAKQIMKGIIS